MYNFFIFQKYKRIKMKKLKLSIATLAMTVLFVPQAQASDRSFGDIYKECGLGAMIFTDTPVAAAVSNIIWDLGSTAVSSNISSDTSCKGGKAKVAAFISKSYDDLEVEIASGEGKYVDTLATMTDKEISVIRDEFAEVVASNEYAELSKDKKVERLYNIVAL
jgi:hypothetical protein